MFGPRRRGFPVAGLFLFAAGFALASIASGASSAVGFLFVLPLLAFKVMFMFFVFGMFMRFAGAGFGRANRWHEPRPERPGGWSPRDSSPPRTPTQAEEDWERAKREAQREIDDLFPDRPE